MIGTGGWGVRLVMFLAQLGGLPANGPTGRNPVFNQVGRRMCRYMKRDQRQTDP